MPNLKRTSRLVGVAALAASTAMTGPIAAYAQERGAVRLAQADAPPPPEPAAPPPSAEPAPEAAPAEEPAAEAPAEAPAAEAPEPPAPAPAPAEQPTPEAPAAQAQPEPAAPEPPAPAPAAEAPAEAAPAQAPTAPPPEEPAAEQPAAEEPPAEPPAEPTPPAPEAAPETPAPADDTATPAPAKGQAPATSASPSAPAETPSPETPPQEMAPGSPATGEVPSTPKDDAETQAPAPGEPEASGEPDTTAPANPSPSDTPVDGAPSPAEAPNADTPDAAPAESTAPAPTPDAASGERAAAPPPRKARPAPVEKPEPVATDVQNAPVEKGGVAASDARVQKLAQPVDVPSITAEQGERIDVNNTTVNNNTTNNTVINNTTQVVQPELPPNTKVVKRVGDRDILSIVGAGVAGAVAGGVAGYFIRGNDDDRIAANADDRFYERLRGQRTRETVVRQNGVQVVTITNRYGDVIQRSKVLPDGREVVLFYDPYADDADTANYYTDPAADLPPLDLTIPRDEYIVDVRQPDEDLYYRTIVAPPVETVERIYSLDEVRRSERIRDKVRRIDLSTINFDFGSDAIGQDQVQSLQALADAIARVVDENPDETFLIEGHTDAVGSEIANLALSDRRAESVAAALTDYFDVPPENLITQGYGESDLKVDTQKEERENRRVTVRRITPLVKPVTTAQR